VGCRYRPSPPPKSFVQPVQCQKPPVAGLLSTALLYLSCFLPDEEGTTQVCGQGAGCRSGGQRRVERREKTNCAFRADCCDATLQAFFLNGA